MYICNFLHLSLINNYFFHFIIVIFFMEGGRRTGRLAALLHLRATGNFLNKFITLGPYKRLFPLNLKFS